MSDAPRDGAGTWHRVGLWQRTLPGAADGAKGPWLRPAAPVPVAGGGTGATAEPEQPRASRLAPRQGAWGDSGNPGTLAGFGRV